MSKDNNNSSAKAVTFREVSFVLCHGLDFSFLFLYDLLFVFTSHSESEISCVWCGGFAGTQEAEGYIVLTDLPNHVVNYCEYTIFQLEFLLERKWLLPSVVARTGSDHVPTCLFMSAHFIILTIEIAVLYCSC